MKDQNIADRIVKMCIAHNGELYQTTPPGSEGLYCSYQPRECNISGENNCPYLNNNRIAQIAHLVFKGCDYNTPKDNTKLLKKC